MSKSPTIWNGEIAFTEKWGDWSTGGAGMVVAVDVENKVITVQNVSELKKPAIQMHNWFCDQCGTSNTFGTKGCKGCGRNVQ